MTLTEFCRVWEASASLAEVTEATGVSPKSCSQRAYEYRRRGVKLKRFGPSTRPNELPPLSRRHYEWQVLVGDVKGPRLDAGAHTPSPQAVCSPGPQGSWHPISAWPCGGQVEVLWARCLLVPHLTEVRV